jgi:cbb3-type cytochrome oxidase subunit 3
MQHRKAFTAAFGFAWEMIFLSAVWAILYRRLAKESKENRMKVCRAGQYL